MGCLESRETAKLGITDGCGISAPLRLLERALVQGWLRTPLQFYASVVKLGMHPQLASLSMEIRRFMKDESDLLVIKVFRLICSAPLGFTGCIPNIWSSRRLDHTLRIKHVNVLQKQILNSQVSMQIFLGPFFHSENASSVKSPSSRENAVLVRGPGLLV